MQLAVRCAVLEQAVTGRGFAVEQRRVGGKTHRFQRDTTPALIELTVAIAVLEQLDGIAPRRHIGPAQLSMFAAQLAQRLFGPALLFRAYQRSMQRTDSLNAVHCDQNVTGLGVRADQ